MSIVTVEDHIEDSDTDTCLFCGEPEMAQVHEIWGDREFSIETCCEGMHESFTEFLNEDPRRAGAWLSSQGLGQWLPGGPRVGLQELHQPGVRRVIDRNGQLILDWNIDVRAIRWRDARDFVRQHHRHCPPPAGWKFGASLYNGRERIGVVMVGRPVARKLDHTRVVEVNRLCIRDDIERELWNGCSKLYAWASQQARKRKFARIVTYTLIREDGTSLRAAGWVPEAITKGGSWHRRGRARVDKTSTEAKVRWAPAWCAVPACDRIIPVGTEFLDGRLAAREAATAPRYTVAA